MALYLYIYKSFILIVQLVGSDWIWQISANETWMSHILMKSPSNLIMGGLRGKIIIFRGRRTLAEFNFNVRKDKTKSNQRLKFGYSEQRRLSMDWCLWRQTRPRLQLQIGVDSGGWSEVKAGNISPSGWVRVSDVTWGVECQSTIFADQTSTSTQILHNVSNIKISIIQYYFKDGGCWTFCLGLTLSIK